MSWDDGVLGCSGISWTICKQSAPRSRHNRTNTPSLNFYGPDALPDAQPTVSKHCKQTLIALISVYWGYGQKPVKRGPSRVVWCVLVYVVLELSTVSLKPSAQKNTYGNSHVTLCPLSVFTDLLLILNMKLYTIVWHRDVSISIIVLSLILTGLQRIYVLLEI